MARPAELAVALSLAAVVASCAPKLELPAGAQVTCASTSQCPSNLVCHSGYCVDAAKVDTVPPDLAAPPAVTPAVGRAGASFTVTVTSTKDLLRPPTLVLGLDTPVEVACAPVSGRTSGGRKSSRSTPASRFTTSLKDVSSSFTSKETAPPAPPFSVPVAT